jgi:PhnB protein
MILLNAYIHFKDTAREAMEFYQTVFGGHLDTITFKDGGVPADQADGNLLMHAKLDGDNGMVIMGSDTPAHMNHNPGNTITMSLSGDDESTLRGYWDKLSVGATIDQPLNKAPWGDTFGMLTDKYGVEWMVDILPVK